MRIGRDECPAPPLDERISRAASCMPHEVQKAPGSWLSLPQGGHGTFSPSLARGPQQCLESGAWHHTRCRPSALMGRLYQELALPWSSSRAFNSQRPKGTILIVGPPA